MDEIVAEMDKHQISRCFGSLGIRGSSASLAAVQLISGNGANTRSIRWRLMRKLRQPIVQRANDQSALPSDGNNDENSRGSMPAPQSRLWNPLRSW